MSFEKPDIKQQKLIYHMTDMRNLDSILCEGIKPRSQLTGFSDVADHEILAKRKRFRLDEKVPFHFFVNNPFDGGVVKAHPTKTFVILGISRAHSQAQNWEVIPRHPLANEAISLMTYDEGMEAIDWVAMNKRDYSDANSKSVCMAECLAPGIVDASHIHSIFVKTDACEERVTQMVNRFKLGAYVNKRPKMFPRATT
ncbi:DarT ssDNA thymidine ADP-ribosyltransferase family protein [Shewanella colwelliana]|uniref:DarT ssDNA thymidine ADP-ribosyltransferase family protein n=1 Tax=Shewanella colwelliana TaxID=23 RepID=UPI0022AF6464|nr:DarT ssDNA thymidine ADP-ribosyltransferase family protein [Shewanella colwelliana]MCZ4337876.1 DarT ssDNA thymidine ADP-ribosyltransferase family protein [Shewanella colwelliana]